MRFAPYLPEIKEYLDYALRDNKASACCRAATMCIGDLARSLGENIADLLPTIIPLMISNM